MRKRPRELLKLNDANPLAVFGLRQLAHCPPHFTPVDFECLVDDKDITDWIWANLDGRFYFGDVLPKEVTLGVGFSKRAAFETAGEASYFALVLSTVNHDQRPF